MKTIHLNKERFQNLGCTLTQYTSSTVIVFYRFSVRKLLINVWIQQKIITGTPPVCIFTNTALT